MAHDMVDHEVAGKIRPATRKEVEDALGMSLEVIEKYNSACRSCRAGDIDAAWNQLEECAKLGFGTTEMFLAIENDICLRNFRDTKYDKLKEDFFNKKVQSPIVESHLRPLPVKPTDNMYGPSGRQPRPPLPAPEESSQAIMDELAVIANTLVGQPMIYESPMLIRKIGRARTYELDWARGGGNLRKRRLIEKYSNLKATKNNRWDFL